MAFKLPELPYAVNSLEPFFDEKTMMIHHGKHHAGYTNKLNAAIAGTSLEKLSIKGILKNAGKHGAGVRNNGGGFFNHSLFWKILSPKGGGKPKGSSNFGKAFNRSFKSFEDFKTQFSTAAQTRFGSGWAWLCVNKSGGLFVTSTPNQDNPLMDVADKKGTPILGLDVWEHAYYLKYQNKRPDYVQAFFNLINWDQVNANYEAALVSNKKENSIKSTSSKNSKLMKSTAKKATAKKPKAKKATAKRKPTAKKKVAKKATAKKATAKKKPTAKKATTRKTTAKKSTAKKATAKRKPAAKKKTTAKKTTAKKSTAKKKTTAKKTTAKRKPVAKKKSTAKKTTARKTTAKRKPARKKVSLRRSAAKKK